MSFHQRVRGRPGFSRSDLLVLIVVMSLFLPLAASCGVRTRDYGSSRTQTINNLKQMGLAMHGANDVYRKCPPAFDGNYGPIQKPVSIHVHLMPYIEQDNLYKVILEGQARSEEIVPPFQSPADWSAGDYKGVQNMAANLRVFSTKGFETGYNAAMPALGRIEPGEASIPRSFEKDGTSNVIVFATKYATCGEGGSKYAAEPNSKFAAFFGQNPAQLPAQAYHAKATYQLAPTAAQCLPSPLMAQSFGTGGLQVCLADASCRNIAPTISPETWNLALQPNDGKKMPADWEN